MNAGNPSTVQPIPGVVQNGGPEARLGRQIAGIQPAVGARHDDAPAMARIGVGDGRKQERFVAHGGEFTSAPGDAPVQPHACRHGGEEADGLAIPRAEGGQGRSRAEADEAPADSEQHGAQDQASVQAAGRG